MLFLGGFELYSRWVPLAFYNPKENCIYSFRCKAKHSTLPTCMYKQTFMNGLIIDMFLC